MHRSLRVSQERHARPSLRLSLAYSPYRAQTSGAQPTRRPPDPSHCGGGGELDQRPSRLRA
jgi:hypothetical protein